MKKTEVIRVIGCQGSIQLITATNAVLCHQQNKDVTYRNHLLVYELYSPQGQDVEFFEFIKRLALSGPLPFDSILYLSPDTIQNIQHEFLARGLKGGREKMRNLTGIALADELFLTSNWHPGNKILMHCLPSVSSICYGDSIGLYIPEGYFSDKTITTSLKKIGIIRLVAHALGVVRIYLRHPARRPRLKIFKPLNFTVGYYLTLGLTRETPKWPVTFIRKNTLLETFNRYLQCFSFDLGKDPILKDSEIAFLLTTNFSEAQKMSLENERQAYKEYIYHNIKKGTTIIVKPHPRDSKQKLERLKEELIRDYKVKILDNHHDLFVPFELSLIMLNAMDPQMLRRSSYHTFSSACLSIKILFGQTPHVGMGTELVNKYFEPSYRASRIKHEADLNRLLAGVYE